MEISPSRQYVAIVYIESSTLYFYEKFLLPKDVEENNIVSAFEFAKEHMPVYCTLLGCISFESYSILKKLKEGEIGMTWEGKSKDYGSWSDLPIKHDAILHCDHCNSYVPHEVTSYHDCDYRVCKKCGYRTKWVPAGKQMEKVEEKKDDERWQADFDKRRDVQSHLGRPKGSKNRRKK